MPSVHILPSERACILKAIICSCICFRVSVCVVLYLSFPLCPHVYPQPTYQEWTSSSSTQAAATQAVTGGVKAVAQSHAPVDETASGDQGRLPDAVGLFFCDHSADLRWFYLDDKGVIQVRLSSTGALHKVPRYGK